MVLSPADLASIETTLEQFLPQAQALATALFPDTCAIYRDIRITDAVGQEVVTPDPSPRTDIPCRVSPTGGGDRERAVAERLLTINTWDIALPANTDIVKTDRIVYAGDEFEILAVQGPRSFEIELIVVARRLPL
jgi:hypothetical protein